MYYYPAVGILCIASVITFGSSPSQAQSGIPEGAATLAFVFDTTGSMYDDLVQVRAGASQILAKSLERKIKPLYNYALVPFHDPDVGPATITTNPDEFQRHLDELHVHGGGDCPEMSLSAIMLALEISLPGSFIYVFTDAQAKDMHLTEKVLKLVQQKQSQVIFVLTGDCKNKSADPDFATYRLIAATSTGQVFNLKKKDVNQVLKFVQVSVRANKVNLLSIDVLDASTKSYLLPLDSAVERVTVSLSGRDATVKIRDPDGTLITPKNGLHKMLTLKSAVSVAVRRPRPGLWNITVSCSGGFTLRITGLSPVHFIYGFSLRPYLNGIGNLLARPAAGFTNFAVVKVQGLSSPGSVNRVQLLGLQGHVLQEVTFIPRPSNLFTFDWVNFQAPSGLFYIRVVGRDLRGHMFYRCSPTAISAILPDAPQVSSPAVREVLHGSPVILFCTVNSVTPFRSQWMKDRHSLGPVFTRIGRVNVTHSIRAATKNDDGKYTCFASNVGGTATAVTRLVVKVPRPVIIERDNGQLTVQKGDTIVLRCTSYSVSSLKVKWYKDGKIIHDTAHVQSNATLFLHIQGRRDAGRYRCVTTSDRGQIARTTTLTVLEPPFIVIDTSTKNFQQGEDIHCACQVQGFPEPTVEWSKNGQLLTSRDRLVIGPDKALTISRARPSDAGRYVCTAWNVAGQSRAVVILRYTVSPSVYVNREEITARLGDTVTLECRASGEPVPRIQWYKGRLEVRPNRRITTSSRGHLIINAVQRSDTGSYTCVAVNIVGSDSVIVSFSVQVPPRIQVERSEVFVTPGGDVSVQCLAVGIPPPVIAWYKDRTPLRGRGRVHATDVGELVISRAVPEDAGIYSCVARSIGGSSSAAVRVTVGVAPRILTPPEDQVVTIYQNVTFLCSAQGIPIPKVSWRNNLGVAADNNLRFTVLPTGALHIRDIRVQDAGRYTCIAENQFGRSTAFVKLILIGLVPPAIVRPPRDLVINRGDVILLECDVKGIPTPRITWYHNNRRIRYTSSVIKIPQARIKDSGIYRCTAKNLAGTTSRQALVTVYAPPSILKVDVHTFTGNPGNAIVLPCSASGSPQPVITWFKNGYHVPLDDVKYSQNFADSLRITGLVPQDTGIYTCRAHNTHGHDTRNVTLVVQVAPKIVQPPKDLILDEGQTLILECIPSGFPVPQIRWRLNGTSLAYKQSVLEIRNVKKVKHQGTYLCIAGNTAGRVSAAANVIIRELPTPSPTDDTSAVSRPEFVKRPEDTTVDIGSDLLWDCTATGNPPPVLTWQKGGQRFHPGFPPHITILANNSLRITNIRVEDEGMYQCHARSSSLRHVVQAILTVRIHGGWGGWQAWGPCTRTCGTGTRYRYRTCENPAPANGGRTCQHRNVDSIRCGHQPCPVNGQWSLWEEWTPCSKSCGGGTQVAHRTCSNPPPSFGGQPCSGPSSISRTCNDHRCVGVDVAIGRVTGHVNKVMLADFLLRTHMTKRKSNVTEVSCSMNNLPGPIKEWLQFAVPIVTPVYWAGSGGQSGSKNGLERTGGLFNFTSHIRFPSGELLSLIHKGRGINHKGELIIDVDIKGGTPKYPKGTNVSFSDFKDTFVQTGTGKLRSFGVHYFVVNGKRLAYSCNYSVSYAPPIQSVNPFSQTIEVMEVDVSKTSHALEIKMKTFQKRSPQPQECPQGLMKDPTGEFCKDIDECAYQGTCSHVCQNGFGTFRCMCRPGYYLLDDERTCQDLDECKLTLCPNGETCINTPGHYRCDLTCTAGYTKAVDRSCEDIDECREFRSRPSGAGSHPCTHDCVNSPGSYRCTCNPGYELKNGRCKDIDECYNEICSHGCRNFNGSYECYCFKGYKLATNGKCIDIDECKLNRTICGTKQCANTKGRYECLQTCNVGFKRTLKDGKCVDLNECLEGGHNCRFSHFCMNTYGSFYCTCPRGYKATRPGGPCEDLNECTEFPGFCQYKCENTRGSFRCLCPPGGYLKPDGVTCGGVDGCTLNNLRCAQRCSFSEAGYRCDCTKGYRLDRDKQTCIDINECASNKTNSCQYVCINTMGGYRCRCPAGYIVSLDGKRCEDVNECTLTRDICRQEEECFNTRGSYRCVRTRCPSDYNTLGPGFCVNSCNIPGYCAPRALRYYKVTLPYGVPANQDLLRLIPYYPPYLLASPIICEFQYSFSVTPSPFGIRRLGNEAIIFTAKPLNQNGMHELKVTANIKYMDGTLACKTDFRVFIDIARFLF